MKLMGKEGLSLKKTIITLLLAMTFVVSMAVSVFAVKDDFPYNIVRISVEQAVSE